ncbi:MAG: SIMPL domain-containing protein [bacterium]
MNIKQKHSIFASVAVVFLVSLIVWVVVDIDAKIKEGENTISVSGTGEVYASPDLAITFFSVVTEAKTVSQAVSENTENMNAIIAFIKSEGIADKDLKTTGFNIYPLYEWCDASSSIKPCPVNKRNLTSYEVRQTLQTKIRDLVKIGSIIQGATDNGANQVGNLSFTIDDEEALKEQARKEAIKKAKAKAKELTSQLGVKLGKVVYFSEGSDFPKYYMAEPAVSIEMGGGEAPQIETGENKISVIVSITYEIY